MKSSIKITAVVILASICAANAGSDDCSPSGTLTGKNGSCNTDNNSECCAIGKKYDTYTCSPAVTRKTTATLTLNGFAKGQDGGGASSCDGIFHENTEMVVALSTGWFDDKKRCGKSILITANSRTVRAKVVDECDSRAGCDAAHAGQVPCKNNIVDASAAVWEALKISPSSSDYGYKEIVWTDSARP